MDVIVWEDPKGKRSVSPEITVIDRKRKPEPEIIVIDDDGYDDDDERGGGGGRGDDDRRLAKKDIKPTRKELLDRNRATKKSRPIKPKHEHSPLRDDFGDLNLHRQDQKPFPDQSNSFDVDQNRDSPLRDIMDLTDLPDEPEIQRGEVRMRGSGSTVLSREVMANILREYWSYLLQRTHHHVMVEVGRIRLSVPS